MARGGWTVVWAQRINNAQGRIRASGVQCYGLNSTGTPEAGNRCTDATELFAWIIQLPSLPKPVESTT